MKLILAFRHDTGSRVRYWIARVTGSPVHVANWFTGDYVDAVIEADWHGVTRRPSALVFADQNAQWSFIEVPMDAAQVHATYLYALNQVGKRYDRLGVLFHWWAGRRAGLSLSRWFCSKLSVAVLRYGGIDMQPARAAAWTPRALWDLCAPWRAPQPESN